MSPEANFCSQCGAPLGGTGVEGLFGPSRRTFGVLAPGPILVLALVLLVGGILVLVAGSPIAAIVLLVLAAAAFVFFVGAADRDPADPIARRVLTSGRRARGWAAFSVQSVRAWARAGRDVARLQTESRSLRRERKRTLYALGDAAYREDAAGVESLRTRLREIDEALRAQRNARDASLARARRQVEQEHAAVQPTQTFSVRDLTSGDG